MLQPRLPRAATILAGLISICSVACALDGSAVGGELVGRQNEHQLTEDLTCGVTRNGKSRDSYRCPSSNREQEIIDNLLDLGTDEGIRRCCSEVGFCGSSSSHCGLGCQPEFGFCNPRDPTDQPKPTRCGPKYGDTICLADECCSSVGFCGNTTSHCKSPDCQLGFGRCDASLVPDGDDTSGIARAERTGEHIDLGVNIIHCKKPGTVALTYDDGPYNHTNELLDLLEESNVKATFFVTGNNLGKGPIDDPQYGWDTVIKRMHDDGHQVASHTWGHSDLDSLNEKDRRGEMVKLEMALRNILGFIPTYMRPPYSRCSDECLKTMKDLGYKVTLFDLDTEDAATLNPDDLKSGSAATLENSKDVFLKAVTETHPHPSKNKEGSRGHHLAIAHDLTYQSAVELSKYMLKVMKDNGWEGVTVGKCLGESGARGMWYRDEQGNPVPVPGYDDLADEEAEGEYQDEQDEKEDREIGDVEQEQQEEEVVDSPDIIPDAPNVPKAEDGPSQEVEESEKPKDDDQADAQEDSAGNGNSATTWRVGAWAVGLMGVLPVVLAA